MRARLLAAPASLALLLLAVFPAARAQTAEGRVELRNWPEGQRRVSDREARRFAALPSVSTLRLGYRIADAGATPAVDVAVEWTPGQSGFLRGRRVAYRELPQPVHLTAFALTADVVQRGKRVAGFALRVDSARLAAGEVLALQPGVAWADLFEGVGGAEARRIVADGFTLTNLRMPRATFVARRTASSAGARRDRTARRDGPDDGDDGYHRTVVVLDGVLDATWHLAWLGDLSGPDRDSDDDEDEGGDLLPAALTALGAVGVVAAAGGSLGYYGTPEAPVGLAAGRLTDRGGVLLQASANPAALGMRDGTERVDARLMGSRALGRSPVQAYLALGVRLVDGPLACEYDVCTGAFTDGVQPLVSLGGVLPAGPVLFFGGVDVLRGRPEYGLLFRFRR